MKRQVIYAGVGVVVFGLACGGRVNDRGDSVEPVMVAGPDESIESGPSEAAPLDPERPEVSSPEPEVTQPEATPDDAPFAEESPLDTGDGLLSCEWSAPDSDPMSTLCGAAINVLMAYCADCHSQSATRPSSAGPTDVGDWELLSREGYVRACAAEQSPVITLMRANEMPTPEGHMLSFPVSAADVDIVIQMIDFDCTDEEKLCAAEPAEPGCAEVLLGRQARQRRTN